MHGWDEYDSFTRSYYPAIVRTPTQDPHAENYYDISPYAWCKNNPILHIDPNGMDPIYAKNFWGRLKTIGDDGQKSTGSYLVRGSMAREVKAATKAGKFYTGNLSESKKVMHVPTGKIQQAVQQTATATINSGSTPDTRIENGGHTLKGDASARIWDTGNPVQISTDADGNTEKRWSVTPFKIGGKRNQYGGAVSDIQFFWHIHPNGSTPSGGDEWWVGELRKYGFIGNSFLVDVNNDVVMFFNEKGPITGVKYSDFIKMGKQEVIK